MSPDLDSVSSPSDFKIGEWWVRPQRHVLERAGESNPVELRSMDVLVCLARHAPKVVTKEALLDEVWADSPYVGDDVISHAIWELRKVLGDSAKNPSYIRTVPRRGYQLMVEVLRPQGSPLPLEGVRIDHYEIGPEIGRGAMGVVYEATDRRLSRQVAIKFLAEELTRDPKACRRFEREARLAASLDHPNLGTVYEVGETSQGHRYLVTPLYRGGSLKDHLAEGPFSLEESLRLVRQLIAGLGAAHERGIVHRDIKPANLLLDEHGTLKICDFGIAKLLGGTDLTRTGNALGTPAYQSPEQSRGREVDHRTDLWSAGVVFHELLTGRRPERGAGGVAMSAELEAFLGRALAEDPADRFQSAAEILSALRRLAGSPEAENPRPWLRMIAAVFLVLASGLVGAYLFWRAESPMRSEGETHLRQGCRLWLKGNHTSNLRLVRGYFEAALVADPASASAKAHMASFLAERYALFKDEKDRELAYRLARESEALEPEAALPKAARAWLLLLESGGKSQERVERLELAWQLALEAVELELPSCGENELCDLPHLWLAEALWMRGEKEEAFRQLDHCLEVGGGGPIRCRLKKAQLLIKSGQENAAYEAERLYREVLELRPEQSTARDGLGHLFLATERRRDALAEFWKAHRETGDPRVMGSIGYSLYALGLYEESIRRYRQAHEEALRLGLTWPAPMMSVGEILEEVGRKDEAVVAYTTALEIFERIENPGVRRAGQRAVLFARVGRFAEAAGEIDRQFELQRHLDYPRLFRDAARVAAMAGDFERLIEMATRGREAGLTADDFLEDLAFAPFREDDRYRRAVEREAFGDIGP